MLRRELLAGAGGAALAALVGCSSPNPNLYTISVVPGVPQPGGPHTVVVREVGLARYLERSQIVRSSENYRLDVRSNDWWGEPLGSMLDRVLVEELSQRLPGTSVFSELGAISAEAGAVVELDVQRMDVASDGALLLIAQVAVTPLGGARQVRTRAVRLSVPVAGADTRSTVAAISTAVGQLADTVAAVLRG